MFDEESVAFSGVVLAIVIALVLAAGACNASSVSRQCLKLGYPGSTVTWGGWGDSYCIKRVDQTDTVVPLEQAHKGQ